MSARRRYLRKKKAIRVCQSKIVHQTEGAAWAAARSTSPFARAYRCRGTKGQAAHWHVTGGRR